MPFVGKVVLKYISLITSRTDLHYCYCGKAFLSQLFDQIVALIVNLVPMQ